MGRWEQFSPKYVWQCFWTNVDVDETLAYVHECQFLLLTVCKRQIKGQTSTSIPQKKPMCLCISYLISYLYNCLAHILLSSEYTLNRILIAQESFKIILCICSKDSLGFFLSKKSWGCPSVGKLVACFSLASRLQYSIYRASSARTYQVQKQVGPVRQ